jgi:hypothetical protein
MHPVSAQRLVEFLPLMGFARRPPTVLRRWRAHRITALLPQLMEEFHAERPPEEVLDCADAVVGYYEERRGCAPRLGLARRRTRECLRAGVCEGLVEEPVTGSPLWASGNLIPT